MGFQGMSKLQGGLTVMHTESSPLGFEEEWVARDIVKASLLIELSPSFMDKLKAFGIVLPSSLSMAVPRRKYEFMAGRACVKAAMNLLGEPGVRQVGIGEYREPLWPVGFGGSISHSITHAVALVARGDGSVGVDLQEYLSDEVAHTLSTEIVQGNEMHFARKFPSYAQFVTAAFSAKESLFKFMFRDIRRYVDFSVAEIFHVDLSVGELRLRLTEDLSSDFFKGREIAVKIALGPDQVESFIIE